MIHPDILNTPRWIPLNGKVPLQDEWQLTPQHAAYDTRVSGGCAYPGFVYNKSDNLCCIDVDVKEGQTLNAEQAKVLVAAEQCGAVIETSWSGRGYHIFCTLSGVANDVIDRMNNQKVGLELFNHSGYIVITGNHVSGADLPDMSDFCLKLFYRYKNVMSVAMEGAINANRTALHTDTPKDDDVIKDQMRMDPRYACMLDNFTGTPESELDFAFMNRVVFLSRNDEQCWRLWANSSMAQARLAQNKQPNKLTRLDYVRSMVLRAWDAKTITAEREAEQGLRDPYPLARGLIMRLEAGQDITKPVDMQVSPSVSPSHSSGEEPGPSVAASVPVPTGQFFHPPEGGQAVIDGLDPWTQDMGYVLNSMREHMSQLGTAAKQLPQANALSALCAFSSIFARSVSTGIQSCALFGVSSAVTGAGKSLPLSAGKDIIRQMSYRRLFKTQTEQYPIHADCKSFFADACQLEKYFSPQALHKTFLGEADKDGNYHTPTPMQFMVLDEIGKVYAARLGRGRDGSANDVHNATSMALTIHGGGLINLGEVRYASKSDKCPAVNEVACTEYGVTTPRTLMAMFSEEAIEEGLTNRFLLTNDQIERAGILGYSDTASDADFDYEDEEQRDVRGNTEDKELIHYLRAIRVWASEAENEMRLGIIDGAVNVKMSKAALAYKKDVLVFLANIMQCIEIDTLTKEALSRFDGHVNKLAAIIAVSSLPMRHCSEESKGKYEVDTNNRDYFFFREDDAPTTRRVKVTLAHYHLAFQLTYKSCIDKMHFIKESTMVVGTKNQVYQRTVYCAKFLLGLTDNAKHGSKFKVNANYGINAIRATHGLIAEGVLKRHLGKSRLFSGNSSSQRNQQIDEALLDLVNEGALLRVTKESVQSVIGLGVSLRANYYYRVEDASKLKDCSR